MIDYASAKAACETYVRCLEESELETLLDLFADDATIEDPVGTDLREGKDTLREFYTVACCLLYTSPSPRDVEESRMPSSA